MANNSLSLLVEFVRPEIARFAPFNFGIQVHQFTGDPTGCTIELSSPIFGGLKATAALDEADFISSNAKRLEDTILTRIETAIHQIEDEAELFALVDYKWPKAA